MRSLSVLFTHLDRRRCLTVQVSPRSSEWSCGLAISFFSSSSIGLLEVASPWSSVPLRSPPSRQLLLKPLPLYSKMGRGQQHVRVSLGRSEDAQKNVSGAITASAWAQCLRSYTVSVSYYLTKIIKLFNPACLNFKSMP